MRRERSPERGEPVEIRGARASDWTSLACGSLRALQPWTSLAYGSLRAPYGRLRVGVGAGGHGVGATLGVRAPLRSMRMTSVRDLPSSNICVSISRVIRSASSACSAGSRPCWRR